VVLSDSELSYAQSRGEDRSPSRATVTLPLRDIQLRLSQWGYWGPLIHNMGLCSRPGEDPNAWKQFGPDPGNRASA